MPETPRKRPGGRTARVGQAVHDAVRTLVEERGPGGFTGRDVAERAGVNEATIYRRWGNLDNLMLDVAVAVTRLNEYSPIPDTGSLREDLRQWGTAMAAGLNPPDELSLLRTVVAVRAAPNADQDQGKSQLLADFLSARTAKIQQILDRAAARGEAAPDITAVLDRFVAPLYLRAIFQYGDIAHDLETLIDNTLAAPRDA
jgi:AcrR family transcriptional regulator